MVRVTLNLEEEPVGDAVGSVPSVEPSWALIGSISPLVAAKPIVLNEVGIFDVKGNDETLSEIKVERPSPKGVVDGSGDNCRGSVTLQDAIFVERAVVLALEAALDLESLLCA